MRFLLGIAAAPAAVVGCWIAALSLAASAGSAVAGDWPMFRGGPARLGHDGSGELPETRPALAWVHNAGKSNMPTTFWSSPLVSGNRLYVGGSLVSVFGTAGSIYSLNLADLDPATKKPRLAWKYKAQFAVFSSPALARGLVLCGEGLHTDKGARLYALKVDAAADSTNRLAWDYKVDGTLEASPCVEGDCVYFGAADDVYCLELGTGRLKWKTTVIDALTPPVVAQGVVYVGSGRSDMARPQNKGSVGQQVVALKAENGQAVWRQPLPYPCSSPITVVDGKVIAGAGRGTYVESGGAGQVSCHDAKTGQTAWTHPLGDVVMAAMPVERGLVHVACRNGSYYLLSLADGRELWKYAADSALAASPVVSGDRVLLVSIRGVAHCLDVKQRKALWKLDIPEAAGAKTTADVLSSPVLAGDRIYVGVGDLGLVCLQPQAATAGTPIPDDSDVRLEIKTAQKALQERQKFLTTQEPVAGLWNAFDEADDALNVMGRFDEYVLAANAVKQAEQDFETARVEAEKKGAKTSPAMAAAEKARAAAQAAWTALTSAPEYVRLAQARKVAEQSRTNVLQQVVSRDAACIALEKKLVELNEKKATIQAARAALLKQPAAGTAGAAAPRKEKTIDLGGGVKLALVWIPPGVFMMGSPDSEEKRNADEWLHKVKISRGFWLGKCEVSASQWVTLMGGAPSPRWWPTGNRPICDVTWDECQEFLKRLSQKLAAEKLKCRLPTEAEWEYACRAGTTTAFFSGAKVDSTAMNCGELWRQNQDLKDVGSLKPNAFGLHDMHGNAWEWCADWYGEYPGGEVTDPQGPATGTLRVIRGGAVGVQDEFCRSASRRGIAAGYWYHSRIGLRVVLDEK